MVEGGIQSVERAGDILWFLAAQRTAGAGDVASHLGVHASTASRLLASLRTARLVDLVPESRGRYRLGAGLVHLAGAVAAGADLSPAAQTLCDLVAEDFGLTANVAVRDEIHAVNVAQTVGVALHFAPRHYVGLRTPGHATSSGKLLLAHAPAEVLEAVIADGPTRFTSRTITAPAALRAEISAVRERGWASSDQEWEESVVAVGVPLHLPSGEFEAALTVTGPAHTLPQEDFAEIAARLAGHVAASGRWTAPELRGA